MIEALTLAVPELGNRTYLIHDGEAAVVVDPQRDIDRVITAAATAGLRIAFVAETHIHNDYVSGGWALATRLGVPYLVAAEERTAFERRPVRDGDEITVSPSFSLEVVATPGHTAHHVSYLALDRGRPVLACTGGSLLYGSTGRTDLAGEAHTEPLARRQFRSVQVLGRLPDSVKVLPTHGFGSFCSPGARGDVEGSTIGEQRTTNLAFRSEDEDAFVHQLLSGLTAYPSYYRHMAARNLAGALEPDLTLPPALDAKDLQRALGGSNWVVDLRPRTTFARSHLVRSVNIEHSLQFSTYFGWLIPEGMTPILMAETAERLAGAQQDLTRIGIDRLAGAYVGTLPPAALERQVRSYPVRGFVDLVEASRRPGQVTLDVRRDDEWATGHLEGAVHLPLHELWGHLAEIPDGTLWVHCAAGFRAGIAASLLERQGRTVVLVDDQFAKLPVEAITS
jgi:hydroxyacylglutathione hydrolase